MYVRIETSLPEIGAPEPGASEPEAAEGRAPELGPPLPDLDHNAGMGGKSGACDVFVGLTPQRSQVLPPKSGVSQVGALGGQEGAQYLEDIL